MVVATAVPTPPPWVSQADDAVTQAQQLFDIAQDGQVDHLSGRFPMQAGDGVVEQFQGLVAAGQFPVFWRTRASRSS
jgi:hypothetical protein